MGLFHWHNWPSESDHAALIYFLITSQTKPMPGWIPFWVLPGCACPASKHPSNKSVLRLQDCRKVIFWLNLCSLQCSSSPVYLIVLSDFVLCYCWWKHNISWFRCLIVKRFENKILGIFYCLIFTDSVCLSPSHGAALAVLYSTLKRESVYSCFVDDYLRWARHQFKTHLQAGRPVIISPPRWADQTEPAHVWNSPIRIQQLLWLTWKSECHISHCPFISVSMLCILKYYDKTLSLVFPAKSDNREIDNGAILMAIMRHLFFWSYK